MTSGALSPYGATPYGGPGNGALTPATVVPAAGEIAAAAGAAQAKAMVEARYAMAFARPRDVDQFRFRVLRDCNRLRFAMAAKYSLPRAGKNITGPTIRFVEGCLRAFGNIHTEATHVYEDAHSRVIKVQVTDLETNTTFEAPVVVRKTVERKSVSKGDTIVGERLNSLGERLFVIEATDDQILQKQNALISKAVRTQGLRLLPGDIIEEALSLCDHVVRERVDNNPDEAKRALVDAFGGLGVMPVDLAKFVGHSLDSVSPAELHELRGLYSAIRDGATSFHEALKDRQGTPEDKPTSAKDAAKAKLKARKDAKKDTGPAPENGTLV